MYTKEAEESLEEDPSKRLRKKKTVIRQSYNQMVHSGLVQPMKTHIISKTRDEGKKHKLPVLKQKHVVGVPSRKLSSQIVSSEGRMEGKLKPIKIKLQLGGKAAKIVRGRGRPSIYEKSSKRTTDEGKKSEKKHSNDRKKDKHLKTKDAASKLLSKKKSKLLEGHVSGSKAAKKSHKVKRSILKVKIEGKHRKKEKDHAKVKRHDEELHGKHKKVLCVPKSKKNADAKLAKQILAKAKQTSKKNSSTQGTPPGDKTFNKSPSKHKSLSPVLVSKSPPVSSRSSRLIIPPKRFIEEEDHLVFAKQVRAFGDSDVMTLSERPLVEVDPTAPSSLADTGHMSPTTTGVPDISLDALSPASKQALLDRPLIIEGKRQRKPSMKIIMKLSEGEVRSKKLENRKRIEEIKQQGASSSGDHQGADIALSLQTEDEDSHLEQLEKNAEATKRSGQSILRKAKLQLNRAAINRSKAALARSLKVSLITNFGQGGGDHEILKLSNFARHYRSLPSN